ncbi:MAG: hypothetical protein AB8G05_20660 [Oligoflexales bacterium]
MDSGNKLDKKAWNHKLVAEEALLYNTKIQFKSGSSGAYSYACRNDTLNLICSHMVSEIQKKWEDEDLIKEAKKYSCLKDFINGSVDAYVVASKRKIINLICSHMNEITCSQEKKLRIKTLSNEDRSLYNELREERLKMGLKPIQLKIRTCMACKSLFESIGDRTCGCTIGHVTNLAGIEVV